MQRLYANTMPFYTKNVSIHRLFTEESWNPSFMDAKGQLYFARNTKSISSYLYLLFMLLCQMWYCRFFKYLCLCSLPFAFLPLCSELNMRSTPLNC